MNAELKAKWLAALRSDDYKQAHGQLRDKTGYCCIGVLCDVIDPSGWIGDDYADIETNALPTPYITGVSRQMSLNLAEMNDAPHSFAEIADYIEQNIPVDA